MYGQGLRYYSPCSPVVIICVVLSGRGEAWRVVASRALCRLLAPPLLLCLLT